jgi:hypothetical protein
MGTIISIILSIILNLSIVIDPSGNKSISDTNKQTSVIDPSGNKIVIDPSGN